MRSKAKRAVLGIDAAWTPTAPSGVALVVEERSAWRCRAVAPSYETFSALARGDASWDDLPVRGAPPDPGMLLRDVKALAPDAEVRVAAVDLPLAKVSFKGRRVADDECSRALGRIGCGTHSPSPARPGPLAERMRDAFQACGFRLATRVGPAGRDLIEVYPHAAVVALLGRKYRVPYKLGRARRYWPEANREERIQKLLTTWRTILQRLEREIAGATLPLPASPPSMAGLKRYEDALDALVCAWMGIRYLRGEAIPYGDDEAAIWAPARY